MRTDALHNRPSLLMLSDRFPDPNGDKRAARAWRLLGCAAGTHKVYLSVGPGCAINLDQWRPVADLAVRVHIESRRPGLFASSRMHQGAYAWARQRRFDAMLVTSPRIWPGAGLVETGVRVCDFACDEVHVGQDISKPAGLLRRLVMPVLERGSSRRHGPVKVSEVIAECDHLLVAKASEVGDLPAVGSRTVSVPGSGEVDSWAGLFQEDPMLPGFVAPEVTVMPIHPVPSRKAA